MKRLQSQGVGSKKRQAEVLTEAEENLLWKEGFLGATSPQTLLDAIVFYNGLYFALRSGREHRQLRSNPCQIEVIERPGQRPYLRYTEDVSKNHPGGLKGRKQPTKVVNHHSNDTNPERCFVALFKKYRELCPPDVEAFHLKPSLEPSETCWYTRKPLGHNILSGTVSSICKLAGIQGFKTNHSLRATATSRLYQSGVDEQLVMERTGHRSVEGVRSYKRTSDRQREALSDILNRTETAPSDIVTPFQRAIAPPSSFASAAFSSATQLNETQFSSFSLRDASFVNCSVNFISGGSPAGNFKPPSRRRRPMVLYDSNSD